MALGRPTLIQIRQWHDKDISRVAVSEDLPEQDIQDGLLGCHWFCDLLLYSRSMHKYLAMRVCFQYASSLKLYSLTHLTVQLKRHGGKLFLAIASRLVYCGM